MNPKFQKRGKHNRKNKTFQRVVKQTINTPISASNPASIKKGYRKAVFVVVYKTDKITKKPIYLLLKRKKHWTGWEFVKGGIDPGEQDEVTARREVYEETGLRPIKLDKYPFSGKYGYKRALPDRPGYIGQTFTLFSAEIPEGEIRIDNEEHSGFAWKDFQKAMNMLTYQNQKACLSAVNKKIKNPEN